MTRSHRVLVIGAAFIVVAICGSLAHWAIGGQNDAAAPVKKHRVVLDLTKPTEDQWALALNNVDNLQKVFGADEVQIEVVAHNKGLGVLLLKNPALHDRMKKQAAAGVVFAACQNTMRAMGVTRDDLVPFATPVDSGAAEVVRREEAGWSYLKPGE